MRFCVALIMLVSVACAGPLFAAEAPAATPAEPAPNAESAKADDASVGKADEKPAAKADEEKEQASASENAPAAKSPADSKASPQRFVPSEQVRADFDVSFPIDI